MENLDPMFSASSSPSSTPKGCFDIFLSFRVEDTRNNFTGHLQKALRQKGFRTLFDDDELQRGKEISPKLLKAIEDSDCSVVVLSDNYASSSWCLTELAKIVECLGTSGQVLPIFYHVEPIDVRNQEGSYGEALRAHEKNPEQNSEKVQSWRNALKAVGNLAGWHVIKDTTDESKFIKEFIIQISRKLEAASLSISKDLFGINSRLQKLESLTISPSSDTVQFIGIHGMSGIGKTTLAKAYYNQNFYKFDASSFLANVGETCEKRENGLMYLQTQLLSNMLKDDKEKIDDFDRVDDMIKRRLRQQKVLIVLDNVSKLAQLEALAYQKDWFGSGSLIIVTTGDQRMLRASGITAIYEAEILTPHEALQLFSRKAFESSNPPENYKEVCEQVIEYANGLPLTLAVLGSYFGGKRSINDFDNALNRLREYQDEPGNEPGRRMLDVAHYYTILKNERKPTQMENWNPMFSVTSSSSPQEKYDVFLSFRGEGTCKTFASHLFLALCHKGFHPFFAEDKLERGKEISPELLKVIEDSDCSIVVLSENYAYSSRCLTELAKIVECKGTSWGKIIPIFYHVDPGHVRNQIGSYGEALKKHEEDAKHNSQKVQRWRDALKTVARLIGWHVTNTGDEPMVIKDLVKEVSRALEEASLNLRKYPMKENVEPLKTLIFDDLFGSEKAIFLDIACFFNKYDKDHVIEIMDSFGLFPQIGALIAKSLLTIQNNKLNMNDLLQQMGKEIVLNESPNEPGKRSRIWNVDDFFRILENGKGSDKIEAIVTSPEGSRKLSSFKAISDMKNLRLLMILDPYNLLCWNDSLTPDFKYLSNELRWLQWDRFPYKCFPRGFEPRGIVQLKLVCSRIEMLWNHCFKPLYNLKIIDLSHSEYFSEIQGFRFFPNLERLILDGCVKLSEIDDSITVLHRLISLSLVCCKSLKKLPKRIEYMSSLEILDLYGCSKLRELPEDWGHLKSLKKLDVRGTGISHLATSIFLIENLEVLRDVDHKKSSDDQKVLQNVDRKKSSDVDQVDDDLGEAFSSRSKRDESKFVEESNIQVSGKHEVGYKKRKVEVFTTKRRKLKDASQNNSQVLFGINSRLEKFKSCTDSPSSDTVRFIGICGRGGIGKTTLAKAYYDQNFNKFDGYSFIANVRETCIKRENGLVYLQTQLLSHTLEDKNIEIDNVDRGVHMIRRRLQHKRVLIVLDDVDKLAQLKALAFQKYWFRPGSIIIVTTRDQGVLRANGISAIYEAELLSFSDSLQLFSQKAFKSSNPPEDYKEVCEQVIEYAKGLPLALSVLGSFFGGKRSINDFEDALNRLREYQKKEIIQLLKISFDDLEEIDRNIFLDIACFFNEYNKDRVIEILDSCDVFNAEYRISNLIEKSFLGIDQHNVLHMHDLLQEMGKEIVRNESPSEPGRRSRIWDVVDFYHILENGTGTDEVESIVTSVEGSKKLTSFEAISQMKNLRLLMIFDPDFLYGNDSLTPDLEFLSCNIQWLQWDTFPYKCFPSSFRPQRLVKLKLVNSSIEKLWRKHATLLCDLKIIDLSDSWNFTTFEDFTAVPNLERLILEGCIKLSEIHDSITSLEKLIILNLASCTSLKKLPKSIKGMNSLEILNLNDCLELWELPEDCGHLKSLKEVDVRDSGIDVVDTAS